MNRLGDLAIRHPRATILTGVVLTLALGSGLPQLELRTDGQALVPSKAPEVLYDREVRAVFDVEDQVAVVVKTDHPAGIFNRRTLRLVDELTGELRGLDGVDPREVTSLATEHSRLRGAKFKTFLDPFPESDADLAAIRDELAGLRIYTGTLVARDGEHPGAAWTPSATAILIGVERGTDGADLHRRLAELVATRDDAEHRLHVVGAPIAESLLGRHILADLMTLVPIAVLVMSLVFAVRYRSLVAVLLPMSEVGAALVAIFGLMGHLGIPVTLPVTVLPVILTALGVADEIHVFDRYFHLRSQFLPSPEGINGAEHCLRRTLEEMWRPVVKTSVTTSVGFLSFTLSPIAPVRHFGLFTALGVLFCMVWTLSVIPAGLTLARRTPFSAAAGRWPERFGRLGDRIRRSRRTVLATAMLLTVAVPFGLGRLEVQDSWLDGFAETSPFLASTETVNRLFHGTHLLFVHLDAGAGAISGELQATPESAPIPERFTAWITAAGFDPAALVGEQVLVGTAPASPASRPSLTRRADLLAGVAAATRETDRVRVELEPNLDDSDRRFLSSRPGRRRTFFATGERMLDPRLLDRTRETGKLVEEQLGGHGGVLDPSAQLSVARYILRGRRDAERRIGTTPIENRHLVNILGRVRGPERLAEMIDPTRRQALIAVFLENANYRDVGRLMEAIREHARSRLAPLGIRVGFAGDVAVSQAMIGAIVSTQVRSLLLTLLGIFLVAALLGGSLKTGGFCLLPPAVSVALGFALMGGAGIPLGVATSMFAAMTIGLGVDFAIHLTERFRRTEGADLGGRLRGALEVTGPAILTNTLVVALGFGVMVFSSVPANRRLGLLVAAGVLACCAATLTLLPPLLAPDRSARPLVIRANEIE